MTNLGRPIVAVLPATACLVVIASAYASPDVAYAERKIARFEVRETAGVRRRNDVVSATFVPAAPMSAATSFRLLDGGKPLGGQIRTLQDTAGNIKAVKIDFIGHFAPLESRGYELEYGEGIKAIAEPNTGFDLKETDDAFHVSNGGRIEWTVRKDLRGLYRFRHNPNVEFVREKSAGLLFRTRDGKSHHLAEQAPSAVRVARKGPISCALDSSSPIGPRGPRAVSNSSSSAPRVGCAPHGRWRDRARATSSHRWAPGSTSTWRARRS